MWWFETLHVPFTEAECAKSKLNCKKKIRGNLQQILVFLVKNYLFGNNFTWHRSMTSPEKRAASQTMEALDSHLTAAGTRRYGWWSLERRSRLKIQGTSWVCTAMGFPHMWLPIPSMEFSAFVCILIILKWPLWYCIVVEKFGNVKGQFGVPPKSVVGPMVFSDGNS